MVLMSVPFPVLRHHLRAYMTKAGGHSEPPDHTDAPIVTCPSEVAEKAGEDKA